MNKSKNKFKIEIEITKTKDGIEHFKPFVFECYYRLFYWNFYKKYVLVQKRLSIFSVELADNSSSLISESYDSEQKALDCAEYAIEKELDRRLATVVVSKEKKIFLSDKQS